MKVKDLKVGDIIIWIANGSTLHVITNVLNNGRYIKVSLYPPHGFTDYPDVNIDNCIVVI